ncbi:MAG: hypothetical protein IJB59_00905 [Oscillospiraceae bacterium]|nr:hypothetical protein [Oscillospiraceae bacterium]
MKKTILTITALICMFALVLTGCGSKEAPETTAAPATTAAASAEPQPLGLSDWNLSTSTWSSPNGATVHLTATPFGYEEGQSAAFIIRLEGEDVASIPCTWNGTAYTADAELNAADGYCYYVAMTAADGSTAEIAVNTPSDVKDEALINMAESLNSYCTVTVETSAFADGKLTITSGDLFVQVPKITNNGETITVSEAVLTLWYNDEAVDTEKLTLEESESVGGYELSLTDISFKTPEMEDDHQLTMTLDVKLSNGQSLSCAAGTFFYNDGQLLTAVG